MRPEDTRTDIALQLLRLSGLTVAATEASNGRTSIVCEDGTSICVCQRGGLSFAGAEAQKIWAVVRYAIEDSHA
jgi:hypothetical protein